MAKQAISAPFHKGINLTNWLEYRPTDEIRKDYYTKQDFINVKSLGCDVVRLPIHFENFCKPEEGYKIPEKILGILDDVVEWTADLNLYVIFDFHNSTHADSATSDKVGDVLIPIWQQLAERYRDAHDHIVFELMNEPHNIEVSVWNEIIAKVFASVRAIDKKHYIVVGGADWNSFEAMKTLPDFKDDKVIYTFHFYDPHTFTHQGAVWCHMERVVGIPFPYAPEKMPPLPENPTELEKDRFASYPALGTIEAVSRFFDKYAEFSIERNAPVYCGEFGCFAIFADKAQRANWYKIVTDLLEERNLARTSWDYYGGFGIFDFEKQHEDGFHFPEDLNTDIVKALGLNL